ncbi:hypothetical protein M427DRAFT_55304 [Gonapodya prolifera JEL478]|uniref:Uncharacterized protein n=1 Tax=Gonapodya prolifera (strain JEL478) TaxID=1344416 RepID=A0A139AIL6_GONPJ|nr:hypothetical protein M427DRAFT_55304 [Gonapodya prolifera JEL478]|eukprot:KXS16652.1 hypothetical protein M427DRAFT_55304 [Gonapodya prolifera JEL478]
MSDVVLGFGDMGGGGGGGSASLGKTSVEGVFSDSGSGSFAAVLDGDAVPVTDFFLEGEFGME